MAKKNETPVVEAPEAVEGNTTEVSGSEDTAAFVRPEGSIPIGLPENPVPGMIILLPLPQIIVNYNTNPRGNKSQVKADTPIDRQRQIAVEGQTTAVEAYVTDVKARGKYQFKVNIAEGFCRMYAIQEVNKGNVKDEEGKVLDLKAYPGTDGTKVLVAVQLIKKPEGKKEEAELLMRQISNNNHKQWSNTQKCANVVKLEDEYNMSVPDIGNAMGMTRELVYYYLKAGRNPKLLKGIEEGWLSIAAANKAAVLASAGETGGKSAEEIAAQAQTTAEASGGSVTAASVQAAASSAAGTERYSYAEECAKVAAHIKDEDSKILFNKKSVGFGKRFNGTIVDDIVQIMIDAQVMKLPFEDIVQNIYMAQNFQDNPDGGGLKGSGVI